MNGFVLLGIRGLKYVDLADTEVKDPDPLSKQFHTLLETHFLLCVIIFSVRFWRYAQKN